SAKSAFLPMIMINDIQSMLYYTVNVDPSIPVNPQTVLNNIKDRWKKVYPENPFSYFFLEDRYQYQYQPDLQTGKVFLGFSIFAILITCLGLLGLSSYMVITRTKEIGIRKVLGATRKQILFILSKDFVTLLGFSALLAVPLGYHFFNLWLDGFAFRIDISHWLLILPVIFVALLSMFIVSAFSFRAASINPVETLRSE
ncbi:MAG: ABC transporter permease, partial [Cyclobacteriaceae bacterium]